MITYLILNYNPNNHELANNALYDTVTSLFLRKDPSIKSTTYLLDQSNNIDETNFILSLKKQFDFSTIFLTKNISISGAVNFIARTVKTPFFALVTSDIVLTTGFDKDCINKLITYPEIYQVCPLTNKSELPYQQININAKFGSDNINLSDLKEIYIPCIGIEYNIIFWRTELFDKIGFLDERWLAGYENNDFSLRCFLAGGHTAVSTSSFVWHYHRMTYKSGAQDLIATRNKKSHDIWLNKWSDIENYIKPYTFPLDLKMDRSIIREKYKHNIYLSYLQEL